MQHVVGPALRDVFIEPLYARANPGNGTVVIGALLVDNALKTSLPLIKVISHIWHKVGVTTLALSHDSILVITKVGSAQP